MPTYTDKNGYKRHSNLVHREKAFEQIYNKNRTKYPKPFSEYVVHHKDGNKQNNNIDNLMLLTPEEHEEIHGINKSSYSNTSSTENHHQSSSYSYNSSRYVSTETNDLPILLKGKKYHEEKTFRSEHPIGFPLLKYFTTLIALGILSLFYMIILFPIGLNTLPDKIIYIMLILLLLPAIILWYKDIKYFRIRRSNKESSLIKDPLIIELIIVSVMLLILVWIFY